MEENIHKGHRQRMRAKFSAHGPRVFDSYELLEMLLYRTNPRCDTNPIAKQLLRRFGSVDGVLSASCDELASESGVGAKTASLISLAGEAYALCEEDKDEVLRFDDYDKLGEYFVELFREEREPAVALMTVDNTMRMISVEVICRLDYASGGVKAKPFIDKALKDSATLAVIAHCHPMGPICPSEGDRQTNVLIDHALKEIGVVLIDHYLVCRDRYLGFMTKNINALFEQRPALARFMRSKGEMTDGE